ncbi:undecaprenyl-phosphate galactose phosphotransferase WbaP [Megamonas sp.]|uniref:undecaprenyl-phosphate galactose phosphotransferase WbaP n=1 Tax=Megamonas sp. TaxID=2049033 RepID=UPI002590A5EB|nr:undecaprenyl-phosphate galactose phosphotransferase WbaP [Megamonas sp.]
MAQNYKTNLKQNIRIIWSGISLMADYLAVLLAELIAIYFSEENLRHIDLFIVIPFIYIAFIAATRTYRRIIPFWQRVESLFYSSIYSIIAVLLFFVRANATEHSIAFLALLWLASFICLVIMRYLLKRILDERKIFLIPLLIIGAKEEALAFVKAINSDIGMSSYKIIGLISDKNPIKGLENYPLLGDFKDIEKTIKTTGVNNVLIAIPYLGQAKMQNIIHRVQPLVKNICIIPNLQAIPMGGADLETFFDEKFMLIKIRNNLARNINKFIKLIFDIVVGVLICIPVIPIIIACAIWVKLDSKGPIFYNAKRIGKNGKEFTCYKFRSMYVNSDELLTLYLAENPVAKKEWDEFQKLHDFDPRVTKAGKIMRKMSLDELPQIFNVLKGEMSLVGPRPYLPREKEMMGHFYNVIISTVPGITGYWQVNGRSDVTFEGRLRMDDWYIRNWSVWMDIVLLIKTIKVVFSSKGAV